MELPISAWWQNPVSFQSPDGRWTATLDDASEVAMGAPTCGTLRLGERPYPNCNPSMVWSADSRFLAIPQWMFSGPSKGMQRLAIICPDGRWVRSAPGIYRVLQLERFAAGIVHGIDSPIWNPGRIAIDVNPLLV